MHVRCGNCKTRLSEDVRLAAADERNTNDGESYVPQGAAIQEDDSFFHQNVGGWILNIADVVKTHPTTAQRRLSGCCGLDGMDGPNLLCVHCEAEVATKKTDCWMPHCVIFEPATTESVAERPE
jgi:hypothetical protein